MEVAIGQNGNTPFQREVREWQHIDPNTGALLTGRLEADRWINGPLNKYGKVVDSQNFSQPNGTQHSQRKQLEVLQAKTSNGSMQVIRAQTVQTTSSRTSFHNKISSTNSNLSQTSTNANINLPSITLNGVNDNVTLNNILKTEPSLKLSNLMKSSGNNNIGNVSNDNNSNNSGRISPQLNLTRPRRHNENINNNNKTILNNSLTRYDHQKKKKNNKPTVFDTNDVGVKMNENSYKNHNTNNLENFQNKRETDLQRTRSASIDDLSSEWTTTQDDENEKPTDWQRVSKIRRSFQFPKISPSKPSRPIDLPENSVSVSKIREELENGRRLNTAMRNNHIDLATLDTILNNSSDSEQTQSMKGNSFITAESLREIRQKLKKLSDENLYKEDFLAESNGNNKSDLNLNSESGESNFQFYPQQQQELKHTTNSLQSRSRLKDMSSNEWHLRRKSYGFENMSPPDQKPMFRVETSTDSGIGRSGELENWSPTTEAKGTVITFGDKKKSTMLVLRGTSPNKILVQRRVRREDDQTEIEIKRHSIAVDESKYVRDNLKKVFDTKTSVHLNGFYPTTSTQEDDTTRRLKRVEFCKTEVHFAAESGRVNIVETDGKPPPTNNFRRRRRSSGNMYIDAISTGMQVMHFGDSEKTTIFEQESEFGDEIQLKRNNVTVSIANNRNENSKSISLIALEDLGITDEQQDEITPKGILKNKPMKPKPYHLGENIDGSDSLWGVKLKPVNPLSVIDDEYKAVKTFDENIALIENEKSVSSKVESLSVADHVKIVEERRDGTSYSTKINLNLTDTPFTWNSENENYSLNNNAITNSSELLTNRIFHSSSNTSTQQQHLKSTSLIMQTIHSSSSNYDYNRALNQASGESMTAAAKLISNMREITKSKSANSIFSAGTDLKSRQKYSSSLDGDYILNNETIRKSSSFSSNSSTASLNENALMIVNRMATLEEESRNDDLITNKPIAAPRVKALTSRYMTNGNSHTKQMFANNVGNGFNSEDSADEEVKRYLGAESEENIEKYDGQTQVDLNTEIFNSWSRIEANKNAINKMKFNVSDIPRSNIMSIELKSPESTLRKTNKVSNDKLPLKQPIHGLNNNNKNKIIPTAKPRTTIVVKSSHNNALDSSELKNVLVNSSKHLTDKEQIKLSISKGARQLREHELSYFGVKTSTEDHNKNSIRKLRTTNDINTNSRISNKATEEFKFNDIQKWKLENERPDLLNHSPVQKITTTEKPIDEPYNGPLYENLRKPSHYSRKKDLNRDEKILNEMTTTADQTLKTVAENHRIKDEKSKKRNIERNRTSKPLDTISEKQSMRPKRDSESEKKHYMKTTQEFERKCCSRRSSSASSVESNISSTSSLLREKMRNSQPNSKLPNPKLKGTKLTSAAAVIVRRRSEQHSSSYDDDTSANNSSTENVSKPPQKIERLSKRISSSNRMALDDRNSHQRIKSIRSIAENSEKDVKLTSNRESSTKRTLRKLPPEPSKKIHSDSARKSSDDFDGSKYSSRQSSERKRNSDTESRQPTERTRNSDRESRRSNRSVEHRTKNNSAGYESECLKSNRLSRNEYHLDNHYRSKSSSKADDINKSRRSNRSNDEDKSNLRGSSRETYYKSRSNGTNRSTGGLSIDPIIVNTITKRIASSKHRNDRNNVSSQKKDKTKTKI